MGQQQALWVNNNTFQERFKAGYNGAD